MHVPTEWIVFTDESETVKRYFIMWDSTLIALQQSLLTQGYMFTKIRTLFPLFFLLTLESQIVIHAISASRKLKNWKGAFDNEIV